MSSTAYGIEFDAIGLHFKAQVHYREATRDVMYLSNGDPGYPGDPAELEFVSLTVGGIDAKFLLDSTLFEDIEGAACAAAEDDSRDQQDEARAERAELARDWAGEGGPS